jgi:anthraniloyl-CoA monooxygenase
MRIVCIGGGPAGLYFGLLMKKAHPGHHISVIERNRPYDTFGWGVVFSDATMENMRTSDPKTALEIEVAFNHWDDIEVLIKGRRMRTTGHGFVGIGRKRLLNILQMRCEELGVELVFEREVDSDLEFPGADLIVACDGVNSKLRNRYADAFEPDLAIRPNRFIWLGTEKSFDAFTFDFRRTAHGWFQAHIYKFDATTSTFIIETTEQTLAAHGLDEAGQETSLAFCEDLFKEVLGGAKLMTNAGHLRGSAAWINFRRLVCGRWSHFNGKSHVVLMGDAAHTAHFAIGSGTKLALEDAIELARQFEAFGHTADRIPEVLAAYEEVRRVDVARIQNAGRNAMEWFEVAGLRYADTLEPEQFMYSLLTRSQRVSHENLRLRDPVWLENYERWFAQRCGLNVDPGVRPSLPMFTPYRIRGVTLPNRIVMSPMAMYSATDGVPSDFHLVHLGSRALGGAGLVFSEMTCVSADARITPGCLGLWNDEQAKAWRRIVDFIHTTPAKAGLQLGHAGRKGSTRVAWEGIDEPLAEGGWPLISPSETAYLPHGAVPRAMTRDDMDRIAADFVTAARRGATAGFDVLELHCAHGYLLSSFLSPLTNARTDRYGGSHENRIRFPLEVFMAIRAVWPDDRPISVRLSCHDWTAGGNTPEDAAIFARIFKQAGADLIDCSSGQVSKAEQPVYGRLFQTPFADKIRNEIGIATIAVGAISEADHANSIIAAGRADLCAVARPHLADPAWTLHEAAKIGVKTAPWPKQYHSGKAQYETNLERAAGRGNRG